GHNERLEFLGDAVLELIVTEQLYSEFPDKTEGDLTGYRAALVNTAVLASIAVELGFNDLIMLSKGEARDTGRARKSILADTYESVVGAMFLDQGYIITAEFVKRSLMQLLPMVVKQALWLDAKSKLQEKAQEILSVTPGYTTVTEDGPDHDRSFVVAAMLGEEEAGRGEGKSKQEAEQEAARAALVARGWV
ncbi:MAG TPA: ribonuclease III, partial [Candidatus Paceibacterota bacterium]